MNGGTLIAPWFYVGLFLLFFALVAYDICSSDHDVDDRIEPTDPEEMQLVQVIIEIPEDNQAARAA